jgi:peptide/nickel transport system permease protein
MTRTILRQALRVVPTLLVVTFGSFLLINLLPGDPAMQLVGIQYATPENLARAREQLGLDEPILTRYFAWLADLVQLDFGESVRTHEPVAESIIARIPLTLELVVLAQLVAIGGALLIAPLAALRPGSKFDKATNAGMSATLSIPPFALALVLVYVFAVSWDLFPASGYVPLTESVTGNLRSLVLPTVTLALVPMAVYIQVLRNEMIEVLGEDFVLLAKMRGLSTRYIMLRHVLRPSSLPLLTLIGINVGALLSGAVVTEWIFALPGLGRLTVDAIYNDDYVVVQGIVVFITVAYVVINFLVDLVYAVLDPRIRKS